MKLFIKLILCFTLTSNLVLANEQVKYGYKKQVADIQYDMVLSLTKFTYENFTSNLKDSKKLLSQYEKNQSKDQVEKFKKWYKHDGVQEILNKAIVNLDHHTIEITISSKEKLTFSLEKIFEGKIVFDGVEFSTNSMGEVEKYIQNKFSTKKTTGILDLIIPSAHADGGATAFTVAAILAAILVAFFAVIDSIVTGVDAREQWDKISNRLTHFENNLRAGINQCDVDVETLKTTSQGKTVTENNTLHFIDEITNASKQTVARYQKQKPSSFLNCSNIKATQGVMFFSALFKVSLFKRVGKMCELAETLEKCLKETQEIVKTKGLHINVDNYKNYSENPYISIQSSFDKVLEE